MEEDKVIFIVSCERSGSTLLRLMMSSHPQAHILRDGPAQEFIKKCLERKKGKVYKYDPFTRLELLQKKETIDLINATVSVSEKIKRLMEKEQKKKGRPYIGMHLHAYYELPGEAFPGAKYIHVVRDPRPVCRSLIYKMRLQGNYYGAAEKWQRSIREARRLQDRVSGGNFLEIKYEDMVSKPREILDRVCAFIGIEYTDSIFDYTRASTYSYPSNKNIDSWRQAVSKRDICLVEGVCAGNMESYGYDRLCPGAARPPSYMIFYLRLDNRIRKILMNMRFYGIATYLMVKIDRLLGLGVFQAAERRYLRKAIENIK